VLESPAIPTQSQDVASGLAERVKSILEEMQISRRELSRRAGLHPSHVEQLTANRVARPSQDVLDKIARAAGVSLEWLATGTGPRTRTSDAVPAIVLQIASAEGYSDLEAEVAASLIRGLPHGELSEDAARELLERARLARRDATRLLAESDVVSPRGTENDEDDFEPEK
jgi:transcriptional regulator with XRE-family HTH domain